MARLQETPADLLMRQFLGWVVAGPRTYAEAMERWRTSCPRLSVWEDALQEDLIALDTANGSQSDMRLLVTARGRAALQEKASTSSAPPG